MKKNKEGKFGEMKFPHVWAIYYKSLTQFKAILGDTSLTKPPPFGVTSAEVVINWPDMWHLFHLFNQSNQTSAVVGLRLRAPAL